MKPDARLFGNTSTCGTVKHGNIVKISCEFGYTPSPGEIRLKCPNGSWENGQSEWNKSQLNRNVEIILLLSAFDWFGGFRKFQNFERFFRHFVVETHFS